jgi:arabinofuranosyltransferase
MSTQRRLERPGLINGLYGAASAIAVLLFVRGTLPYLRADFADDDAFISLRYAKRLVEGKGLSWNDGEWVEGYSNLLWVLSEAGLGALGLNWFLTTRVLGYLGMALALGALIHRFRPARVGSPLPGIFALLAFAALQPMVIAMASGFETPYVVGFVAVALVLIQPALEPGRGSGLRACLLAGIPLAAVTLTRPDGALWPAVIGLFTLALAGPWQLGIKRMLAVGLLPALCFLGQLGFRLWRYQDWVPNTAHVKLPGGLARAQEGLNYVIEGLHYQRGLWLVSLLALGALLPRIGGSTRLRREAALLLCLLGAWTSYVIYTGGVWLMGRRFLVASLLLLVWLAGLGLAWLCGQLRARNARSLWTVLLVIALGLSATLLRAEQWRDPQINRAIHYSFHWKKKGLTLRSVWGSIFTERGIPYIAVDTAGAIPFYTDWPALDMLGLMDRHIATNPPDEAAWSLSGHTHGDGGYVIDRAPDLVLFGVHWGCWGGVFTGAHQMHADPRFYELYRYVELQRYEPISPLIRIWLRLDSQVLGVIRTADRVEIPSWFVSNQDSGHHELEGQLRLPLVMGELASATGIRVPAGRWRLRGRFEQGDAWVRAVPEAVGGGSLPLDPEDPSLLLLPADTTLDLGLRVHEAPVAGCMLEAMVLERVPEPPPQRMMER